MTQSIQTKKQAQAMPFAIVAAAALLLGAGALLFMADEAEASHYWGGTLQWNHTPVKSITEDQAGVPVEGTENIAFFSGRQAWRSSSVIGGAGGTTALPGVLSCVAVTAEGDLHFSDDSFEKMMWVVTHVDTVRTRAIVKLVRIGTSGADYCAAAQATGDSSAFDIPHAFPDKTDQGSDWEAFWHSCCRINYGPGGNYHVNNPGTSEQLWTHLNLLLPNQSPIVWLQPLRFCPVDDLCQFRLDVKDYDEDELSYRFATSNEANRGGPFYQPGTDCSRCGPVEFDSQIDPLTGVVSWQTDGADLVAACSNPNHPTCTQRNLYSMHIMVSDGFTHVPVEFMIELVDTTVHESCPDGNPPRVDPDTGEVYCEDIDCSHPTMAETPKCKSPDRPTPGPDPSEERPIDDPIWYVPPPPPQAPWQDPAISNSRAVTYTFEDYVDEEIANKDTDGDGVRDRDDLCPGNPMTTVQDIDLDGIGDGCDVDRDGDGIANAVDSCPNSPANECVDSDEVQASSQAKQHSGRVDADAGQLNRSDASVAVAHETEAKSSHGWLVLVVVGGALAVLLLAMMARRKQR